MSCRILPNCCQPSRELPALLSLGFPDGASGKESACNAGDPASIPESGISPREWQSTPVLLPRESHGQKSLVGYSQWGHKESDTIEQLSLPLFDKLLQISEDSLSLSHMILSGMSQLDFEDSFSFF